MSASVMIGRKVLAGSWYDAQTMNVINVAEPNQLVVFCAYEPLNADTGVRIARETSKMKRDRPVTTLRVTDADPGRTEPFHAGPWGSTIYAAQDGRTSCRLHVRNSPYTASGA